MHHNGVDNLWARRGHSCAAGLLCRPYRRGADRAAGSLAVRPVRADRPRRPAVRARRRRHENARSRPLSSPPNASLPPIPITRARSPFCSPSDEEGPATDGTVKVVEALKARGELLDYCIVGEPTSAAEFGDTIKNGRRGSLSGTLRIKGVQGHIAYPHLAKNPDPSRRAGDCRTRRHHVGRGQCLFSGHHLADIQHPRRHRRHQCHPRHARDPVQFPFFHRQHGRRPDGCDATKFSNSHGLDFEIDWNLSGKPFLTPRGPLCDRLSDAIHEVTGITPGLSTTGGTSDGRFIADICPRGGRIRPAQRQHPQAERARRRGKHRAAGGDLPEDPGKTAGVNLFFIREAREGTRSKNLERKSIMLSDRQVANALAFASCLFAYFADKFLCFVDNFSGLK